MTAPREDPVNATAAVPAEGTEGLVRKASRTRFWSSLFSVALATHTAAKAFRIVAPGYVDVWASSLLLICVLGIAAVSTAYLSRAKRSLVGPPAWTWAVCSSWLAFAAIVAVVQPKFAAAFEDFGLEVGIVSRWVTLPCFPHCICAVGFAVLTMLAYSSKRNGQRRITLVAFGGLALLALLVVYGNFGPLFDLLCFSGGLS